MEEKMELLRQRSFMQRWLVKAWSAFGGSQSHGVVQSHLRPSARKPLFATCARLLGSGSVEQRNGEKF
jgi:hypothetical protein